MKSRVNETGISPLLCLIFFPQMEHLVIYQSPLPLPSSLLPHSSVTCVTYNRDTDGCVESPLLSRVPTRTGARPPQRSLLSQFHHPGH